jgi:triacylglycerol lipase
MGGIVSRYYLQRLGGLEHVNKFIAISSPHYGTLTGYLTPLTGSKQMRPNSAFLKALNKDIARLEVLNPISIWTKYDQMIIPQKSAIMEVGESIHVPVFPHRLMSYSKKVSQLLVDYLP